MLGPILQWVNKIYQQVNNVKSDTGDILTNADVKTSSRLEGVGEVVASGTLSGDRSTLISGVSGLVTVGGRPHLFRIYRGDSTSVHDLIAHDSSEATPKTFVIDGQFTIENTSGTDSNYVVIKLT